MAKDNIVDMGGCFGSPAGLGGDVMTHAEKCAERIKAILFYPPSPFNNNRTE